MPVSEKKLIQHIRLSAARGRSLPQLVKGIGDDCAVLRAPDGDQLLVTTDFTIENVHFRRDWHPPALVGGRCLTRGLSDVAAMGGKPLAAFLSLAMDRDVPQQWADQFMKGLLHLAEEFNVPLAGGDTAQSDGGIQADIVVIGSVPSGKAVLRSGARAGDRIYVTGELGGAAAALGQLMQSKSPQRKSSKPESSKMAANYSQYLQPHARVALGQWLREHGASSMIDVSDGLSTDLEHICTESRVGAEIDADSVPRAQLGRGNRVQLDLALHGGDDYELLVTHAGPLPASIEGVRVTQIGRITRSPGMRLIAADGKRRVLKAGGWQHFK